MTALMAASCYGYERINSPLWPIKSEAKTHKQRITRIDTHTSTREQAKRAQPPHRGTTPKSRPAGALSVYNAGAYTLAVRAKVS